MITAVAPKIQQNNQVLPKTMPVFQTDVQNNKPAFKGVPIANSGIVKKSLGKGYDKFTDKIAEGLAWLAKRDLSKSAMEGMSATFKKPAARMMDLASAVYTISLMKNTASSKKIKKEQKPILLLNAVLVTVVSSTTAAVIDRFTDPILDKANEIYATLTKKEGMLSNKDFAHGASKTKSMFIFNLIVRFVIPLTMIPISASIIKKIQVNQEAKQKQKAEAAERARAAEKNQNSQQV